MTKSRPTDYGMLIGAVLAVVVYAVVGIVMSVLNIHV
jgi:hypothetical protein